MVQVIDDKPHPSIVRERICFHCGVTLSYVPKDVKRKTIKEIGGLDTFSYIVCPKCSKELSVI